MPVRTGKVIGGDVAAVVRFAAIVYWSPSGRMSMLMRQPMGTTGQEHDGGPSHAATAYYPRLLCVPHQLMMQFA